MQICNYCRAACVGSFSAVRSLGEDAVRVS